MVDDVDLNRDVLQRRLARGISRTNREERGEALQMLAADHFDLVLLDILMPDVDGYEVLRQIKESPALRDIPVIMISALDEMRSVVRCIEMGAEDYLPKPFDPILLRARVGACLEKKRLRDMELEYLKGVAAVQAAASAVEAGAFHGEELAAVATRTDELGTLRACSAHGQRGPGARGAAEDPGDAVANRDRRGAQGPARRGDHQRRILPGPARPGRQAAPRMGKNG